MMKHFRKCTQNFITISNMDEIISEDRIINKFPSPYCLESSPYVQSSNFSDKVRRKCLESENELEWLKIGKVVIIGDVSVGKTCLVNRYCNQYFDSDYKSTIGVDFEVKRFLILGVPFILQIWDTAGQERFKSIAQSYYRGAHVVMLVFDLTNCQSLTNCKKWLIEALNANIDTDPFLFLVGTKRDLLNNFAYKNMKSSIQKMAKELQAEYWSVSSKTGKNVNKLFSRVACLCFEEAIIKSFGREKPICLGNKLMGREKERETGKKAKKCCS